MPIVLEYAGVGAGCQVPPARSDVGHLRLYATWELEGEDWGGALALGLTATALAFYGTVEQHTHIHTSPLTYIDPHKHPHTHTPYTYLHLTPPPPPQITISIKESILG